MKQQSDVDDNIDDDDDVRFDDTPGNYVLFLLHYLAYANVLFLHITNFLRWDTIFIYFIYDSVRGNFVHNTKHTIPVRFMVDI